MILTYDPRLGREFWLNEYFPELYENAFKQFPPINELATLFAANIWEAETRELPVPYDFIDKNMHSGWNRPEIYLDEQLRANTSGFARASKSDVERGLSRLQEDLLSGEWDARYGHLRKQESLKTGFAFMKFASK